MEAKMVIVMRKDLKVRRGKEIAQGGHAAMAWVGNRLKQDRRLPLSAAEEDWLINESFKKVVCQVENEAELRAIHQKALDAGLQSHLIIDQGHTEFAGVPTPTCCGIGPDYVDRIQPITGHLKLY